MAIRSWTAEVFVNSEVGVIKPVVQSGTLYGAEAQIKQIYGPVQQIVNLREVRTGGGGGEEGSSVSAPVSLLWIVIGLATLGFIGSAKGPDEPQGPVVNPEKPAIERIAEPPANIAPVAPQPEFKDYPTPPPSYCITENFEPC